MNIYVGNLPYTVSEEDLGNMFTQYGEVASVKLVMDMYSGRSKGFAFVEMPDNSQADTAIKALNKSRNARPGDQGQSGRGQREAHGTREIALLMPHRQGPGGDFSCQGPVVSCRK